MRYRIVKLRDLDIVVKLHYAVRENYPVGIFSSLDSFFLKQYYRVLIKDINSIIICSEDDNGRVVGFCSATLDVEKQFYNLKKKRFLLGISAIPSIIKNPSILGKLIKRYESINNKGKQFISKEGARLEYWVWSKKNTDSVSSLIMHEVLLKTISSLEVKKINFEVDSINKNVFKFHKLNGAIELDRIILEDNRERVLMQYNFDTRKTKIKLYKNR